MERTNNMFFKKLFFLVFPIAFISLIGMRDIIFAATYYVSTSGDDSNSGTQSLPWRTLQHAADVVVAGDTVSVADGSYAGFMLQRTGTANNPITFKANGTNVIVNTKNPNTDDIINIENWDAGGQPSYIILDGLKVTGASRYGIRVIGDANSTGVIIRNCTVYNNAGFGILTGSTNGIQITNNVVYHNGWPNARGGIDGHGIYVSNWSSNPVVSGNQSYDNYMNGIQLNGDWLEGGTGYIDYALVENNTVYNNRWKGLSLISNRNSTYRNNVIYNNGLAAGAGGIHLVDQAGSHYSNNNVVVNNTIVEPNIACIRINAGSVSNVVFNNITIGPETITFEGTGNYLDASSNLQRSSTTGIFVNPTNGDYHLSSNSLAIDIGRLSYQNKNAPNLDIEGNSRPSGTAIDSGAYENGSGGVPKVPNPPTNLRLVE